VAELDDDLLELLVGSFFRSSDKIVIIIHGWMCGLYRDFGDRGAILSFGEHE
jgi:hypothetical protein